MTHLNPAKLPLSKWTATKPVNKEKHFLVTKIIHDEDEVITHCVIEAVHSHREQTIDWQQLNDETIWQQGWL